MFQDSTPPPSYWTPSSWPSLEASTTQYREYSRYVCLKTRIFPHNPFLMVWGRNSSSFLLNSFLLASFGDFHYSIPISTILSILCCGSLQRRSGGRSSGGRRWSWVLKLQPLKEAYKASAIPTFQLIWTKNIEMAAKIPWRDSKSTSPLVQKISGLKKFFWGPIKIWFL